MQTGRPNRRLSVIGTDEVLQPHPGRTADRCCNLQSLPHSTPAPPRQLSGHLQHRQVPEDGQILAVDAQGVLVALHGLVKVLIRLLDEAGCGEGRDVLVQVLGVVLQAGEAVEPQIPCMQGNDVWDLLPRRLTCVARIKPTAYSPKDMPAHVAPQVVLHAPFDEVHGNLLVSQAILEQPFHGQRLPMLGKALEDGVCRLQPLLVLLGLQRRRRG